MRPEKSAAEHPWQLQMFKHSLKKQLKLKALVKMLGKTDGYECLLITCGDNNGALNWHFRERGGTWRWAEMEEQNIPQISSLLNDTVEPIEEASFPFKDRQFDRIVCIDVLEHLYDDQPFLRELQRVLKPGGLAVVTVPNGDPGLLANRIKWSIGMTPEKYGHHKAGYTVAELSQSLEKAGLNAVGSGGYSRFFTEMVELIINFGYVFVLSRKKSRKEGQIAPSSSAELKQHGSAYRLYSFAFPFMRMISSLDALLPQKTDNAVIVSASKTT